MEYITLVISILILIFVFYKGSKIQKINENIKNQNKEFEIKNKLLKQENEDLILKRNNEIDNLTKITNQLEEEKEKRILIAEKEYQTNIANIKQKYEDEKIDWEDSKKLLQKSYSDFQMETLKKMDDEHKELDTIRQTRIAAQKAITREKEIKEQKDFYCLPCSVADRNDIQTLERVKKDLNKPRVLSMLIWSTFFQKPMTSLCNNVLGVSTVTGIYKITNQISGESYIGQAVDVAKRWKDHAKCGLGIDASANNKLYKAMQEYGIWNFSWELIEQCPREQLNEKEKYYIDLYMTNDFGYNSNKGVGK